MNSSPLSSLNLHKLFSDRKRILVTGGAGFIGSCLIRRLLKDKSLTIFNLDKCGYASDLSSIESLFPGDRHKLLRVDLVNPEETNLAIRKADPDFVFHLAAESHVDRSIDSPDTFIKSNTLGTFNLLEAVRCHFERLSKERQSHFRFHHISTDEVFGTLGEIGRFSETTPYDPRSPYSASKASSDHFVNAWHHTYGLPIVLTNCSNNFGPWQFPEKLIPMVIIKALQGKEIPLYGDGSNIRDWLFVEDHVDALLLAATCGKVGESYCVGGYGERSNKEVVHDICSLLDIRQPRKSSYKNLIHFVKDRPGHDHRYAIDSTLINKELCWQPKHNFQEGISITLDWYLENLDWCNKVFKKSGYLGERLGKVNK